MADGKSFPSHNMSTDPNVDFDLMDELLSEGCWLETTQGSDFLQPSSSNPTALFNSSYFLPTTTSTTSTVSEGLNPSQINKQEEREGSIVPRIPASLQPSTSVETQYLNANSTFRNAETSSQPERGHPSGGSSELDRRWWIEPTPHSTVIDRLGRALNHIRCSTKNAEVLIQIWVPVRKEGKQFLITNGQPFELDSSCQRLESYRNASMEYEFPADEDSNESVGLPGRVFLGKVPEWTPDVRFFSRNEYPRIHHAQRYDVRGTLALPIFELGSRSCLGVVEVVMTTQKINYRPELENICKALESVNLRGSEVASPSTLKAPNFSYQAVLLEILEVLRAVCETHRLPLAQTWVPCIIQGNEGCRHSDQINYTHYVSTVNSACCVCDPKIWGFHEACSEHHLFKGQGVVGRALTTNQPCFFSDITTLSKKDYPLSHYARMFGLGAAVAIRLRSMYTGTTDYVLEFFLPVDCRDTEQQKAMLRSLSLIIQNVCRSLRVVMDKELQEETTLSNNEVAAPPNPEPFRDQMPMLTQPIPSKGSSDEGSSWITQLIEVQRKGKGVQKEESAEGFKVTTHWDSSEVVLQQGQPFMEFKQHSQDSRPKHNADSGGDSSLIERKVSSTSRTGGKRRTKMEKTISLQVLRQYFPGSLKDAAKSLGVCPTTLKRICRQHGITRWPSRKIKKVGHSLRKLQIVIDSVRGAEGAFQIGSIYTNFSELTSPNLSGSSAFSRPQPNDQSNPSNVQPEGISSPQAAASISPPSSSCSQSSSSSLCCSTQQNPGTVNLGGKEDTSISEKTEQLQSIVQEDPTGLLERSQSQRYLTDQNPSLGDSLPPIPSSSNVYHDRGAPRLKVTYGEEKVRFSMQLQWGFRDLQQEIGKRFFIDDMSRNVIQYLDDDNEWVLLTCDADLEECMEIYKSYQTQTIKLRVQQASYPNLGSSLGSTAQ